MGGEEQIKNEKNERIWFRKKEFGGDNYGRERGDDKEDEE